MDDQTPTIGVLGGTGPAGSALAARLASVGYRVVIGSRSAERAIEVRDQLVEKWPEVGEGITATSNEEVCELADVVVLATPWDAAAATASANADALANKVVISMANALIRSNGEFLALVAPRGSIAATVQAAVPESLVAAAFHHLPARDLGALDKPIDFDVLVCSDHHDATTTTMEIVSRIPGLRAVDAGELSVAAPIEAFTAVLLEVNSRYRTRAGLRLGGLPS